MRETTWSTLKYLIFENRLLKKPISDIFLSLNSDSENKLIINKHFEKQYKQENQEDKVTHIMVKDICLGKIIKPWW